MSDRDRSPLATPAAVIADHGGEAPFWLAWIHGDLAPPLQEWVREQGEHDLSLARDLRSVEQPDGQGFTTRPARELLAAALEAYGYLVTAGPDPDEADDGEPLTAVAGREDELSDLTRPVKGGERASREPTRARELLRPALFDLLEAVEVPVPPADQVAEGNRLLTELVGPEALGHFHSLAAVARDVRRRAARGDLPALYRVLRGLAPGLFDAERYREQLSYRLYLRARLKRYCRRRGWQPAGPRYRTLSAAFAVLSRKQIGRIIARMQQAPWPHGRAEAREQWRVGLCLAAAEFAA
jgi:hypothetical protein